MPVVPHVHIEGLGEPHPDQREIHRDAQDEDPGHHRGRAERDCRRHRPAHVEDRQRQAGVLHQRFGGWAEGIHHQADHEVDADEADADGQGRAHRLADLHPQDEAEDEDDQRQDHARPEVEDVLDDVHGLRPP
ncbi:hypothetical protein SDC9_123105 [bioreactor metagenome]|uniref:Uncharacterized protein n=1 Tax=bioreactor metagenome TaxID=1076179 RepID=A0A645CGN4_9ZZZZ